MATIKVVGIDSTTGIQKVYETGDTIEGAGGASDFTDLGDVPSSYTGESLKVVRVNAGETGLEFATISGSGLAQYQVRRMLRR